MQDYSFSTGIQSFPMNGTVLKVNLSDNNLYYRFLAMLDELEQLEIEFAEKTKGNTVNVDLKGFPTLEDGEVDVVNLSDEQRQAITEHTKMIVDINYEIDQKVKEKLKNVFGNENDFDAIFQGVNTMAFDESGNRILSNFLNVITPLVKKAMKVVDSEVDSLVGNREQRRARNKR